jgi:hypothetical protein
LELAHIVSFSNSRIVARHLRNNFSGEKYWQGKLGFSRQSLT